MTQDEIIEMAMKAEFVSHGKPSEEDSELFVCIDEDILRFAKLVAKAEREACAKVCDERAQTKSLSNHRRNDADLLASAIRSRDQP